jgi:hypothetical protein
LDDGSGVVRLRISCTTRTTSSAVMVHQNMGPGPLGVALTSLTSFLFPRVR